MRTSAVRSPYARPYASASPIWRSRPRLRRHGSHMSQSYHASRWGATVSAPRGRLVRALLRRPERDELQPVLAGDGDAARLGVEPHEAAGLELELVAVDAEHAAPADDEHHLFVAVARVVVLAPFPIRREDEVVEAERSRAERTARLPYDPAGPFAFEAVDVDVAVGSH